MIPRHKFSNQSEKGSTISLEDIGNLRGGAYTNLSDLIRMRYAARGLNCFKSAAKLNRLSGLIASKSRGRGIDFAEVRIYQPGDDIRSIDWKVTARTRQPHTKLFQEDKECPFYILVDQSISMFFGSAYAFKSVLAAECAALFSWDALYRGDRVGGIIFSEECVTELRARRSKSSALRFLYELNKSNRNLSKKKLRKTASHLSDALSRLRRITKHDSTIVIISDFSAVEEQSILHLRQLMQSSRVTGIHISDPLERELPKPDIYSVTDGASKSRINTTSLKYRENYALQFNKRLNKIKNEFARTRSPLVELSTEQKHVREIANAFGEMSQSLK